MDQTTIIILSVMAGVAVILMIGFGIFAWRSMSRLSHRRFAGSPYPAVLPIPTGPAPSNAGNCPPSAGPQCVPARIHAPEDVPHAIYGLASGCGCDANRLSPKQVQSLVNELNKMADDEDRKRLFERLAQIVVK